MNRDPPQLLCHCQVLLHLIRRSAKVFLLGKSEEMDFSWILPLFSSSKKSLWNATVAVATSHNQNEANPNLCKWNEVLTTHHLLAIVTSLCLPHTGLHSGHEFLPVSHSILFLRVLQKALADSRGSYTLNWVRYCSLLLVATLYLDVLGYTWMSLSLKHLNTVSKTDLQDCLEYVVRQHRCRMEMQ